MQNTQTTKPIEHMTPAEAKKFLRQDAKERTERKRAQKKRALARFYRLNSILGNTWAMFYVLLGSRATGKSYAVTEYVCNQRRKHGDKVKVYWLRISDTSVKKMLANNGRLAVDPDLQRKFGLELKGKASVLYDHGKEFMEILPLSGFGKDKGQARYDKDFVANGGKIIIVLDEFQLEQGEKATSFDILYNFLGMCENIARTEKKGVQCFIIGNTLQEASSILKAFNFLPEKFGRFYLKSKRCVIDNMEPTEEYLKDREGAISDLLGGSDMSNYSNELQKDMRRITKKKLTKPVAIIQFQKDRGSWYTMFSGNIVRRYKNETVNYRIAMRPYLDEPFNKEKMQTIIDMYDAGVILFQTLIEQAYFVDSLRKVRTTK